MIVPATEPMMAPKWFELTMAARAMAKLENIKLDQSKFSDLCTEPRLLFALSLLVLPVIIGILPDIVEVSPPKEVVTVHVVSTGLPPIVVIPEKIMVVGVALFTTIHVD
jgi:hypothetical protein